jgi:hypothetical protein
MRLTTRLKIEKFLDKTIIESIEPWIKMLKEGNLQHYEKNLNKSLIDVHNFISEQLLCDSSTDLFEELKEEGKRLGASKIEERNMPIRLSTGYQLSVPSPYVKALRNDWEGSRHILANHWKIIKGSSPLLYDKVAYCSALCPSYDFAHQTLMKFGTKMSLSSVRDISNRLADHVFEYGEEKLMLDKQDTLAGKRVVIALDGGRTRTRIYNGKTNESGQATYETAWKEPKLFVIDVLDEHGQPCKNELPIYGCRFAEQSVLDLLKSYLKKLEIDKAKQVQILADGAPWIWNHIKPMLQSLGVKTSRIIETLDYYHASGYVHDLVEHIPGKVNEKYKPAYLKQFKEWLWHGKTKEIVRVCKSLFKRPSQLINRWIEYLSKHDKKTQYTNFEANNLMCGSGIIESGIRRIINLRFKNASTFWKKETVEKLYFFRAALLSKRWDLVMNNLASNT